jgi:hypothetical protein
MLGAHFQGVADPSNLIVHIRPLPVLDPYIT